MCAVLLAFVWIEFAVVACFNLVVDLGLMSPDIDVAQHHFFILLLDLLCRQFLFNPQ